MQCVFGAWPTLETTSEHISAPATQAQKCVSGDYTTEMGTGSRGGP